MQLSGLELLYRDMKLKKIERYRFDFSFNNVNFDVFFFIDEQPFILMFGVKVENYYFEIPVKPGFNINPILIDEVYQRLCSILNLKYDPNSTFKTSFFFTDFNNKIPPVASKSSEAKPHEVARYRRNVEESDKVYFMGWHDNKIRNQNVEPKNLEKTRIILGNEAYWTCKKRNISSKWTDVKKLARDYFPPN